ncbi:hypothetical protein U1Q18_001783 [Sarracenia purpurea var. burkii]
MERKMMIVRCVWVLGLFVWVVAAATPWDDAIDCSGAVMKLLPCEAYLNGTGPPKPTARCCANARALDRDAGRSRAHRVGLCECFKATAKSAPIKLARARHFSKLCKISRILDIEPKVDCNK